jgi:hypothetical protein
MLIKRPVHFKSHRKNKTPRNPSGNLGAGARDPIGGPPDQFCYFSYDQDEKNDDNCQDNNPIFAVESKVAGKFSIPNLQAVFDGRDVNIAEDVVEGCKYSRKQHIIIGGILQLYSSMCRENVRFGYLTTGQAIVFLNITDDRGASVRYHLSVPASDFSSEKNTDERWYCTAVARVVAFTLMAMKGKLSTKDAAAFGDRMATYHRGRPRFGFAISELREEEKTDPNEEEEREKKNIKNDPDYPHYPAGAKKRSRRPRQQTQSSRKRCKTSEDPQHQRKDSGSDSDAGGRAVKRSQGVVPALRRGVARGSGVSGAGRPPQSRVSRGNQQDNTAKEAPPVHISDRLYCTQACLRALVRGHSPDETCPNYPDHIQQPPLEMDVFLELLKHQIEHERDAHRDWKDLGLSGACGSIFKMRLSSHGYTFVAKGVETPDRPHLLHEKKVYDVLRDLQGMYIPVCLGFIDISMSLPAQFVRWADHCLLLSYAGHSLDTYNNPIRGTKSEVKDAVDTMIRAIHNRYILHTDADLRNIMYDDQTGRFMVVDFERAMILSLPELPDTRRKTRSRSVLEEECEKHKRGFKLERQMAVGDVISCLKEEQDN